MDIIEINKMTQKKKVSVAELHLYEPKNITKDEATILVLQALKKMYGLNRTVKVIHALGVKNL